MKVLLQKIDWVLFIRCCFGLVFIAIAWVSQSWLAAFFGLVFIVVAIIGNRTKTGCGYGNCYINATENPADENV